MEGGNAASEASGITQFAGTANKTYEACKTKRRSRKPFRGRGRSPPKFLSRKERKVRKETISGRLLSV